MRPVYSLTAPSELELEMIAAMWFETRGWHLVPPGGALPAIWERREDFCRRIGLSSRQLRRKLKRRHPPIEIARGKVKASEEFVQWARKG